MKFRVNQIDMRTVAEGRYPGIGRKPSKNRAWHQLLRYLERKLPLVRGKIGPAARPAQGEPLERLHYRSWTIMADGRLKKGYFPGPGNEVFSRQRGDSASTNYGDALAVANGW